VNADEAMIGENRGVGCYPIDSDYADNEKRWRIMFR
jgi:hypothetical protein